MKIIFIFVVFCVFFILGFNHGSTHYKINEQFYLGLTSLYLLNLAKREHVSLTNEINNELEKNIDNAILVIPQINAIRNPLNNFYYKKDEKILKKQEKLQLYRNNNSRQKVL